MIVAKSIKPARLREKAMRLELLNAMRKAGTGIKKDLLKPTATWKHKPKFEVLVSLTGPGPVVLVATDDDIYRWIDEGTGLYGPKKKPYEIWAGYYTGKSDKKVLVFPSAFTPKTTQGSLKAGAGSSGGSLVHTPYVTHKGIKPRDFDGQVSEIWDKGKKFKRLMEKAMRRAAQVSGNGI